MLLSLREVAKELGVNHVTIWKWWRRRDDFPIVPIDSGSKHTFAITRAQYKILKSWAESTGRIAIMVSKEERHQLGPLFLRTQVTNRLGVSAHTIKSWEREATCPKPSFLKLRYQQGLVHWSKMYVRSNKSVYTELDIDRLIQWAKNTGKAHTHCRYCKKVINSIVILRGQRSLHPECKEEFLLDLDRDNKAKRRIKDPEWERFKGYKNRKKRKVLATAMKIWLEEHGLTIEQFMEDTNGTT